MCVRKAKSDLRFRSESNVTNPGSFLARKLQLSISPIGNRLHGAIFPQEVQRWRNILARSLHTSQPRHLRQERRPEEVQ